MLDEMGADKLLGKGDMLFLQPGTSDLSAPGHLCQRRGDHQVVAAPGIDEPCYAAELMQLQRATAARTARCESDCASATRCTSRPIEIVIREGRGSVSLLQRALGIGYGRAARLIDFMAEDGIVGAYNGSNAREVQYTPEAWAALRTGGRNRRDE